MQKEVWIISNNSSFVNKLKSRCERLSRAKAQRKGEPHKTVSRNNSMKHKNLSKIYATRYCPILKPLSLSMHGIVIISTIIRMTTKKTSSVTG